MKLLINLIIGVIEAVMDIITGGHERAKELDKQDKEIENAYFQQYETTQGVESAGLNHNNNLIYQKGFEVPAVPNTQPSQEVNLTASGIPPSVEKQQSLER